MRRRCTSAFSPLFAIGVRFSPVRAALPARVRGVDGRADQTLGLSAGERRKSSKSCMYLHISSKRRSPRRSRQCCSISATRLPASCLAAARGGKDQLGAPVDGIWPALEVTEPLQIADEFGSGGQAQERPGRQVREPYAVDAHVAEDLQMGFA